MIRIGIICPSEIAFRRFMPALLKRNGRERILQAEKMIFQRLRILNSPMEERFLMDTRI